MNPWLLLAVGIAFVLSNAFSFVKGDKHRDTAWKAKVYADLAKDSKAAFDQQAMWQGVVNETAKEGEDRRRAIQRTLNIALDSLRDRPNRPGPESKDAGVGSACGTGAGLCREDAEFLTREAARANEQRSGLKTCYTIIDKVR